MEPLVVFGIVIGILSWEKIDLLPDIKTGSEMALSYFL